MKRKVINGAVAVLLLTGCVTQSSYEKAIADFLQTDKRGTWTDMQFKVIEMGDPGNITVGDSIKILTDKFEADKSKRLGILNESIKRNTDNKEKERFPSMQEFYQKMIDENQVIADSISKSTVTLPDSYKDTEATKVLAKEVTCKFSVVLPTYNTRQVMTETFVLNAAGDKCYRMKSKKK